jgi:hypothetical protein
MSKFTSYAFPFRCPYQFPTCILLSHWHHTFSPLHPSWLDRPRNIQSAVPHNTQLLIVQYSAGPNYVHIISSALRYSNILCFCVSRSFKCKTDVVKWSFRKLHKNKFQFVPSSYRITLLSFMYTATKISRTVLFRDVLGRARSHQLMLVLESTAATRWETQQKYWTHRSTCFK